MKKFEHLFSSDPIGAYEKIEEDYARYFKAAFHLEDHALDEDRMRVLRSGDNMSKQPYLELLPEYNPAVGLKSIDDLARLFEGSFESQDISKSFFRLISMGLMPGLMDKFVPYGHQIGMMKKAFSAQGDDGHTLQYKNTVITSGTGSGKTEAFLLPLLADIYREAKTERWPAADLNKDWYEKDSYEPCQRIGDTRPVGIRAMILYPMNALVEDQMARLRKALDSDAVRTFMDEEFKGNRVFFGGYNGATIAQKNYDILRDQVNRNTITPSTFEAKKEDVAQRLSVIHRDYEQVKKYVLDHPEEDKEDALYMAPRLGGEKATAEMVTRWDMQKWAPDILITNTSMLGIMLMRKAEASIFEDTKKWLADDPDKEHPTRIFHLVVDELHLYRGTSGSEVACLLRMLYKALGLEPVVKGKPNPQLRILASSASLGNEEETQKYLEEFFGIYDSSGDHAFNVQSGDNYYGADEGFRMKYNRFSAFTHDNFVVLENDDDRLEMVNNFIREQYGCESIDLFVSKYQRQIFHDFYSVMPQNSDGSIRPIFIDDLQKKLFEDNKAALRGFLIFRGYIDHVKPLKNKHKLPRFRFHKFFKYIEGLWGELKPSLAGRSPVDNLSYIADEVGPSGRMMLEMLRCENCGQLFIGGNRKMVNDSLSLTLNYPSLGQIPNYNPTPMVQNKSYREYALFWPHSHDEEVILESGRVDQGSEDHVIRRSDGGNKYEYGQARWEKGFLHSLTGAYTPRVSALRVGGTLRPEIAENGIEGFLYKVVNSNSDDEIANDRQSFIFALPCTCPHCHQNYTMRKYTNSPIRSFRTGIDRSNQIISKELLYQLDENAAKLIGFSDSREDAAKQAIGIEKEQYRDMVRMLFVECIEETETLVTRIRQYIKEEKGVNPSIDNEDLLDKVKDVFHHKDAFAIADAILFNKKKALQKYESPFIPLSDLIDQDVFSGTLVRKLLEKGINPAGEANKYQWYRRSDDPNHLNHWSTAYDFDSACLKDDIDFLDGRYKDRIKTQLVNAIFSNSFGKYMGVSVLDSGIGYICCSRNETIEKSAEFNLIKQLLPTGVEVYEFVDAFIRVLGDNYYFPSNDRDEGKAPKEYSDLTFSVRRVIRHFCEKHQLDESQMGSAVASFIKKHCGTGETLLLKLSKLSFRRMTEDHYLKCECGRVHPDIGFGFCTNSWCMKELNPDNTILTTQLRKHFISFDILEEKKQARKLHTEELSGQTDDIQSRLREFKDLILDDEKGAKVTKPIDMVCVTTTMEVGVDIGSLQAIFQGNMPPTRYNYQQRVGRGGRRGQAFSTAITFCRGRSHDVYYYKKATDEMIGGIPATPSLSLAPFFENVDGEIRPKMKMAIMKRVIVKELLHYAFVNLPYDYFLVDTAGEFGRISDWNCNKLILEKWIQDNTEDIIEETVHRYLDQFNQDGSIQEDVDSLIRWVKEEMVQQIDSSVQRASAQDSGLAKYLSENGFLPMYGMPSDSRNFYHGFDYERSKVRSIDRSTEMAISEFAPGAEKTKDKGKYRVEAISIPIKEEADDNDYLSFFDPDGDALSDRYILSIDTQSHDISDIEKAPAGVSVNQLKLNKNQKLLVVPQAYRSLEIKGNTGTPVENNDRGSRFAQCRLFAKENDGDRGANIPKKIGNVKISLMELGFSDDPTIWHVNDNNGHFYTGTYDKAGVGNPSEGDKSTFKFFNWDKNGGLTRVSSGKGTFDIAIGSKKITEMIKLEINECPKVLNLSLHNGNTSAIRAAFFSAAFLLQRALADKLDISPEEIEITEKIDSDHEWPVIYLSDALANGAGIVSYLYQENHLRDLINRIVNFDTFDEGKTSREQSFMHSLLSEKHRSNCLTACQECLLTYNNRGYHHVLDWRMGVGILNLMLDSNYDFGFDEKNRQLHEELMDYNDIVKVCAGKLRFSDQSRFYESTDGSFGLSKYRIIYHPLWNVNRVIQFIPNFDVANDQIEFYNTFRVLRSDLEEDNINFDNIADIVPEDDDDDILM